MKIIGISGKCGSGKNYIAEQIIYPYFKSNHNVPVFIIGFGDQIKNEIYARDLSLKYDELYDKKTFESRKRLQEYGTDNSREKCHKDIWIRGLDIQIETFKRRCGEDTLIIIPDVRFKNEYEYIKSKDGIVIRIEAPYRSLDRYSKEAGYDYNKIIKIRDHKSETELDYELFDLIVKNDFSDNLIIDYQLLHSKSISDEI